MSKRRSNLKNAKVNPKEEFPNLCRIWDFAEEIAEEIHEEEYDGAGYSEEVWDRDFRKVKYVIGNSLMDILEHDQCINRDVALGIIIAAKSTSFECDEFISDNDCELAIQIADFVLECNDEASRCYSKYNKKVYEFIDFKRHYIEDDDEINLLKLDADPDKSEEQ